MSVLVGAIIDAPTSDPQTEGKAFGLGDRVCTHDGKEFVYVQANGAITGDGYVVSIDENYQAVMVDTDTAATIAEGQICGVADAAFADDDYGWVQIYGACGIRTAASAEANSKLSATSTAGQVDVTGAAGDNYIDGMVLNTATGGSAAVNDSGFLTYPKLALIGTYA